VKSITTRSLCLFLYWKRPGTMPHRQQGNSGGRAGSPSFRRPVPADGSGSSVGGSWAGAAQTARDL